VHPNEFFGIVACKTGFDVVEVFDQDLQEQLKNVHPMNFIKSNLEFPVYKIHVSYTTKNENYKETDRYMILGTEHIDSPDEYSDYWAEMACEDYNRKHPNNPMKDVNILSIEHICNAVLSVG